MTTVTDTQIQALMPLLEDIAEAAMGAPFRLAARNVEADAERAISLVTGCEPSQAPQEAVEGVMGVLDEIAADASEDRLDDRDCSADAIRIALIAQGVTA